MKNKKTIILLVILLILFIFNFTMSLIMKPNMFLIDRIYDMFEKSLTISFFIYFIYILISGLCQKNYDEVLNVSIIYITLSFIYFLILIINSNFLSENYLNICLFDLLILLASFCSRLSYRK